MLIAPSVLSADFADLGSECSLAVSHGADWLHLDIMDRQYVPNLTFGAPVIRSLRKRLPQATLDAHLMVASPAETARDCIAAGVDQITFHPEASEDPKALLDEIRSSGVKAGIALHPTQPLSEWRDLLPHCDLVLAMGVIPGFSGQSILDDTFERLAELHSEKLQLGLDFVTVFDGGATLANLDLLAARGVGAVVMGSGYFGSSEKSKVVECVHASN